MPASGPELGAGGLPTGHAALRPQRAARRGWPGPRQPTRVPPTPSVLLASGTAGAPDAWLRPSSGPSCPRLPLSPKVGTAADDSLGTRQLTGKSGGGQCLHGGFPLPALRRWAVEGAFNAGLQSVDDSDLGPSPSEAPDPCACCCPVCPRPWADPRARLSPPAWGGRPGMPRLCDDPIWAPH